MDRDLRDRLYAYPDTDRPWVRMNFVASVDGSATGADHRSGDLGGEPDRAVYLHLRSVCDVVLVGAGTARDEDYGPVRLDADQQQRRTAAGQRPVPVLALVTRRPDLPDALRRDGVVVVTTARAAADLDLGPVEVIGHGDDEIDWTAVLEEFGRRGWNRVLGEGGPSLFASLTELDLVDELCLTVAPTLTAGDGPRITHGDAAVDRPLTLAHAEVDDGVLLTRWLRRRDGSDAE
ncbi:riboflavin biosynthesis protein RibD C-terminal domain protein [Aeromicrobium marinum DSM 15272]|uniref:Riboflavin biosynthesis protein RibD C-terminal domain protein n=1 Tax=Aeromicrobium marinum DSM 15272 TaxID=585531 RepID=E2S9A7_9ACTN|nr:dihydrofolate reductase family protein [Aeromicrobium marinum]EFQ83831.1 riboflavin biosynthesis protein RibD C-terminal domain protein [Aeromicrobium marinum DSM 15272]